MKHTFGCDRIIQTEKNRKITKHDIYIIFSIAIVALLFLFGFHLFGEEGAYAVISYDGMKLKEISLSNVEEKYYFVSQENSKEENVEILEWTAQEWNDIENSLQMQFTSQNEYNVQGEYNVFVCRKGSIEMLYSSCPDQICVHHTAISKTSENIICLPHKLVIQISGTEDDDLGKEDLDGVVY